MENTEKSGFEPGKNGGLERVYFFITIIIIISHYYILTFDWQEIKIKLIPQIKTVLLITVFGE